MNKIVSQLPKMTKLSAKTTSFPSKKTALAALVLSYMVGHTAWGATDDEFATLPTIKRPLPSDWQYLPPSLPAVQSTTAPSVPVIARIRPHLPAVDSDPTLTHLNAAVAHTPTPNKKAATVSVNPPASISPPTNTTAPVPTSVAQVIVSAPTVTPVPPSTNAPAPISTTPLSQNPTAEPPTIARNTDQAFNPLQALGRFYNESKTCQGGWHYPLMGNAPSDGKIQALADRGYYDSDSTALLSGRVVVSQHQRQIRADDVRMNTQTGQAYATGGVSFGGEDQDVLGVAGQLSYNTQTGQAVAHDVAFASKGLHAHGTAKQLEHQAGRYEMQQATFSTCPPTRRLWQLQAKQISLDEQTGRGVAKNATLTIKNTPILYLPYFNFPLDDRRASGFLLPKIGLDSQNGLQLTTPYYFNLAPNYDATLSPTVYSDRNPRLVAEGRYLDKTLGKGVVEVGYLLKDKQRQNQDRYHIFFTHETGALAHRDLTAFANYRRVSDGDYLSDFDRLGVGGSPLNLPSDMGVNYQSEQLSVNLKAQTFQRLEGVDRTGVAILDKNRPYDRLPQLDATYRLPEHYLPWGMTAYATTHAAYFKKSIKDGSENEKSGIRAYNRLTVSRAWTKPYGYINPHLAITQLYAGFDEKSLSEQQLTKEDGTHHLIAPSVGVDGGLFLQKMGAPFAWFGNQGYQLLAPRVKYIYHTQKDQRNFPNFGTTMAAMSYHQLLADSWFLGYDRVSDLHALTPALNYRYMDADGRTRLDMAVAEQFYLRDGVVAVAAQSGFKKGRSGLAWQLSANPNERLWLDASGAFSQNYRFNAATLALRLEPKPNWLFGLGVVERRADPRLGQLPLSAYTASAIFPINERWRFLGSGQYDRKYKGVMDILAGVTYQDCCIGVTVYGRQYRNELKPDKMNRAVMAEVSLTGLSGGGRLAKLLKERVLGFGGRFY